MTQYNEKLRHAYTLASFSPDPSTQNAALLITPDQRTLATAINEFPRGVAYTQERWERPLKYSIIEHAERNVIYRAARKGIATAGLTMVSPWAACADCARAIIQAGIVRLVTHRHGLSHGPWADTIKVADEMLAEAGVELLVLPPVGPYHPVRRDGKMWQP